jgi:hypothetical protein
MRSDSVEVELSIPELKEAMRRDCVTFFAVYLKDELTLEVPELHEEIWDELCRIIDRVNLDDWVDHIQKLFCVPRGHAKTTLVKLAVILFFRYSRIYFVCYASLTKSIADNACKDIVDWITSDDDAAIYGPTEMIQSNESKGLWRFKIYRPDGTQKYCILKSLGADQQVRGTNIKNQRPQLMIFDDCEDLETAGTPESQAKLDAWLMGSALKASAMKSVRIILGNMINSRTILYRLSKDPAWNPTVYGAIVRDKRTGQLKPLWPAMWTLEKLMEDYRAYKKLGTGHIWIYEMMNMTMDSVFRTSMGAAVRLPRPNPEDVECGIICLDPAFGQKEWNDESALTVHVRIKGSMIPHIVESRKGRWSEEKLLDNLLEMSYYWNLATWGIESVAAQKLLFSLFRHMLKDRQINPDIFTMIPLPSGGTAKSSRILAHANSIGAGSYGVAEEEDAYILAVESYNPDLKQASDDLPDSGAYGNIAWATAGKIIEESKRFKVALSLMQNGYSAQAVHQSSYVPH